MQLGAEQQDKLLRFGGVIKAALEASGQRIALVSRSGLDLSRFDVRYSHAGISLKDSPNTPWSVRQLYYACDERRPKLYDQGIAGFLLGTDDPSVGYVSVVFLPEDEGERLARTALDRQQALQFLGGTYSANAYPFSVRYQNCNQWVMEMLAAAWGGLSSMAMPANEPATSPRGQAQRWLQDNGYEPSTFDITGRPLIALAGLFIPWLHNDDRPEDEAVRNLYRVSLPASIEAFVRSAVPGATRMEFCHTDRQVVVRRGWEPIAQGCRPRDGDTVIELAS